MTIGKVTWSDHLPITLQYRLAEPSPSREWRWHLNESLLQDPEVLTDVARELTTYFQFNDIPESDPGDRLGGT